MSRSLSAPYLRAAPQPHRAEQYILAAPDACLAHIEEKLLSLQGEERATLRSRTVTLLEVYAPGPQAQMQYFWDKVPVSYER